MGTAANHRDFTRRIIWQGFSAHFLLLSVILLFSIYLLPKAKSILSEAGGPLPAPIQMLLRWSDHCVRFWPIISAGMAVFLAVDFCIFFVLVRKSSFWTARFWSWSITGILALCLVLGFCSLFPATRTIH